MCSRDSLFIALNSSRDLTYYSSLSKTKVFASGAYDQETKILNSDKQHEYICQTDAPKCRESYFEEYKELTRTPAIVQFNLSTKAAKYVKPCSPKRCNNHIVFYSNGQQSFACHINIMVLKRALNYTFSPLNLRCDNVKPFMCEFPDRYFKALWRDDYQVRVGKNGWVAFQSIGNDTAVHMLGSQMDSNFIEEFDAMRLQGTNIPKYLESVDCEGYKYFVRS